MVVSIETATADVKKWLDYIGVRESERPAQKYFIDHIIESVTLGILVFNDDHTITHNLIVPLGDGETTKIIYHPRFEMNAYHTNIKNIPIDDGVGRIFGTLATISKLPVGVFHKMNRADYNICDKITVFF